MTVSILGPQVQQGTPHLSRPGRTMFSADRDGLRTCSPSHPWGLVTCEIPTRTRDQVRSQFAKPTPTPKQLIRSHFVRGAVFDSHRSKPYGTCSCERCRQHQTNSSGTSDPRQHHQVFRECQLGQSGQGTLVMLWSLVWGICVLAEIIITQVVLNPTHPHHRQSSGSRKLC